MFFYFLWSFFRNHSRKFCRYLWDSRKWAHATLSSHLWNGKNLKKKKRISFTLHVVIISPNAACDIACKKMVLLPKRESVNKLSTERFLHSWFFGSVHIISKIACSSDMVLCSIYTQWFVQEFFYNQVRGSLQYFLLLSSANTPVQLQIFIAYEGSLFFGDHLGFTCTIIFRYWRRSYFYKASMKEVWWCLG